MDNRGADDDGGRDANEIPEPGPFAQCERNTRAWPLCLLGAWPLCLLCFASAFASVQVSRSTRAQSMLTSGKTVAAVVPASSCTAGLP